MNMPKIEIPSEDSICPGCAKGKLPNQAFPSIERCATCAFELIHSDLKSFPIESYHHHWYIITFFDDFSSMAWICCIQNKNDALTATHHFLKMVAIQYNTKILGWMSNAGGEYKSKAFNDMLKEQGIHIFQSAPHTPQQNGHAERFMHTVMDKSAAMQHDACILDSWWEFSITHATHLYNCPPMHRHNWHTPYEVLNKKQPDIAHLYVFGCAAYIHLHEDVRANKMAPKSVLMVYLGIAPGKDANYLFMRSPNNVLFISAHTIFDEMQFPCCAIKCTQPAAQPVPPVTDEHPPMQSLHSADDDYPPSRPAA